MLKEKTNSDCSLQIQEKLGLESKRLLIFKKSSCSESRGEGEVIYILSLSFKRKQTIRSLSNN